MASGIAQPQAVPPSVFEARRGDTLRSTLQRWSEQAGWQPLAWLLEADADYELQASATFGGDFVTSVQALVDALGSQVPLRVQFHHGNRLLVVEPLK
ncbi:MAG: toxin co-regulated pilus biosynthesis Q family protein [Halomonas sp.]|nr:toxin co-regulated pilus biosynthesis Q family protein [Halomonas sp.]MDM7481614.1 toxin co-regulated pilus biosynthesis Q family protein [Halomonas sp.]